MRVCSLVFYFFKTDLGGVNSNASGAHLKSRRGKSRHPDKCLEASGLLLQKDVHMVLVSLGARTY